MPAPTALFDGAAPTTIIWLGAIYFVAYLLKGAFGLGALTPAVLFGSLVVGPHHAIVLAALANGASQVQFLADGWRSGDRVLVGRILLPLAIGAALGLFVFARLDAALLSFVLGIALGVIVLADLLSMIERAAARIDLRARPVQWLLASISGAIGGLTGAGGLFFLAAYFRVACPDPRSFRGTTLLVSAVTVGWRTVLLAAAGFITAGHLAETAMLLPAIVGGGWVGARLVQRLPARAFFAGVQVLMLMGAASLVVKGWPW
ncbi:MAG: sulfite exporter TauE/SafE family protein [Alphaproteobacteria bacterium]|nr:sulfite exporter TauE/SafE family protein [Alphaproteobacteria bacterium]